MWTLEPRWKCEKQQSQLMLGPLTLPVPWGYIIPHIFQEETEVPASRC